MAIVGFASDIVAEQKRTLANAQATDAAVQSCTGLDASTKAQWAAFYTQLTYFCNLPVYNFWWPWMPSEYLLANGNTGNTMLAYEAQLQAWQQRIAHLCPSAPPTLTTFDPNPTGVQVSDWLKYGAIIAGFVGTAYAVAEVAPIAMELLALAPKSRKKEK